MTAAVAPSAAVAPRWKLLRRPTERVTRGAVADYAAIVLLAAVTAIALLAPVLAPYDPVQPIGTPKLTPLSPGHLLGTDSIGRDVLSRVLLGLRTSSVSLLSVWV